MAADTGLVIDLCAGPGGWEVGAEALGLSVLGIEHDAAACRTRAEADLLTVRQDIRTLDTARFGPLEGLIASPPCPTFSAAGSRAGIAELPFLIRHVTDCVTGWRPYNPPAEIPTDPRSALVLEPLRFAIECVPTWIALEQVPEVLPVWEAYQYTLRALGWSVWTGVLNSADYGVPQTRRRAILIAHRNRLVLPPEPTHCKGGALTMFGELAPWVSMAAALGWTAPMQAGFPRVDDLGDSPDGYRERDWRDGSEPAFALTEKARSWVVRSPGGTKAAERLIDEPAATVAFGHDSDSWVLREQQPHGAARTLDQPAMTISSSADNGNFAFVLNTGRDWKEGGTRDDAQCIPSTDPAPALDSQGGKMHWAYSRPATTVCGFDQVWPPGHKINSDDIERLGEEEANARYGVRATGREGSVKLTVSHALVLQSFPADYPVQGTKTKQFEQVGNAIPPLLARHILGVLC